MRPCVRSPQANEGVWGYCGFDPGGMMTLGLAEHHHWA